ncbi:MAG: hypothetical protein KDN05_06225, partial [Verrucomicrobiae bacterium]|nr:hypothetical protein [Verrucomicrobiae bacterium]
MKISRTIQRFRQPKGFALLVTLSLMILLTLIAVGFLSLGAIALRTSSQGMAASVARNNARLALMLAIGDLQKAMGPDQRVSAPAGSVNRASSNPHLVGAWDAWHWAPQGNGAPPYSEKQDAFRGWLVSSPDPEAATEFSYANSAGSGGEAVELVAPLQDAEGKSTGVEVDLVPVRSGTNPGNLGWAVFDESTKAAVDIGDSKNIDSPSLEVASRKAPDRFRADILDSALSSLEEPVHLISLDTAMIPGGGSGKEAIQRRFHDFTTGSLGLLTNVAEGGLKTDLTQLFEPTDIPSGAFDSDTPYSNGFASAQGAPLWTYLQSHYQKYKNTTARSGDPSYSLRSSAARRSDLKISETGGIDPSPEVERMLPAIAKLQIVFSVVSHTPLAVENNQRRNFLNQYGDPQGFQNYGVPHLVYDTVVTLYNPYDVTLDLEKTRIRVWDPPVGFRFRKIDNKANTNVFIRGDDQWAGLAQFQIVNERNYEARKCFTLVLADGTGDRMQRSLELKPGEVKVFAPRVARNWTWGTEANASMGNRANGVFFDWEQSRNFGNVDNRPTATFGKFGVESVPGWDYRAGLQTDHLSFRGRPDSTKYRFEADHHRDTGYVDVRLTDDIVAEVKPMITSGNAGTNFQVDVLAGVTPGTDSTAVTTDINNQGVVSDTLRSYRFNFGSDLAKELCANPDYPEISRQYQVSDILQTDSDRDSTAAYKKPFAMLEMSARTTRDQLTDSKPWLHNNFIVEGGQQDTSVVGLAHQSYDVRLRELTSVSGFPNGIDIDPDTNRGYYGANGSISEGSSFVNMLHVPLAPAASLGEFVHANLAAGSFLPRVVHPFGNSRAHPLIESSSVARQLGGNMLDHSYLLNDALWDGYYFSSITAYKDGIVSSGRGMNDVLNDLFEGSEPALNSRMVPVVAPG